jgi:hypothetical protein
MVVPGPIWRRHRHFLVPDRQADGSRHVVVLDETTGRRYAWNRWPPGSTTIGVPTTWTFLHRGWTDHVFVLVEEPEHVGRAVRRSSSSRGSMLHRLRGWLRSRVL